MKKALLFNNIIAPTNTPLFNMLNLFFKKKGVDFKVFFNSASESNRNWNYENEISKFNFEYSILESKKLHNSGNKDNHFFHINTGIWDTLNQEDPDIIIHAGWASLSGYIACYWCRKNKRKFYLWSGSTKYEKSWRRLVTFPIVKWIVRNSFGFLSYGTRASEYLIELGAKPENIQPMYNTVDIDYFKNESNSIRKDKEWIKDLIGINTKHILMFNGQIIERKGIWEMIEGYDRFQKEYNNISLLIVGSGIEEIKLKEYIEANKIQNVFFTGFVQFGELPKYYAISDIFTLPSREEVWGLVINEAMACGLPIITAYEVGASVDLVKEDENGYIMKENTGKEFYNGLKFVFDNNLISGNTSSEIISNFTLDKIISNLNL